MILKNKGNELHNFGIYTFCWKKEYLRDQSKYQKQYMIGEVNLDAEKYKNKDIIPAAKMRIAEELKPKNGVYEILSDSIPPIEKIEDLQVFSVKSPLTKDVDKRFHKFLRDYGYKMFSGIDGSSTEIYNITREELDQAEYAWENNDPDAMRGDSYCKIPRKYQRLIQEEALLKFSKTNKILLYVATRAGKSFISLQLALKLKAKRILIVTPFPTAETSFKEEVQRSSDYKNYKYIKLNASTDFSSLDMNKNYVFFASWQYLNPDKENCKIFQKLFDIDFLIIDEIHNSSDTNRSSDLIDFIPTTKNCKQLWMSGTPFEDILSGRFNKKNTVMFSLFTFIKYSREEEKSEHPEIFLPHITIRNFNNLDLIYDELEKINPTLFSKENNTSAIEAFHTHGKFDVFNTLEKAEAYLRYLLGTPASNSLVRKPNEDINRFFTGRNSIQNVILVYLSSNKEVEIFTQALINLKNDVTFRSPLHEYAIKKVSGESNVDQLKSDEDSVNTFIESSNRKVIIVSCDKLTTGVTLPALDTIWLFKNVSSMEKFQQIIARPLSEYTYPDGSIKKDVTVYAFDSDSTLSSLAKLINFEHKICGTKKSYKEEVEDTLDFLNFEMVNDDLSFSKVPAEDFLADLKAIEERDFNNIKTVSCFRNLSFLESNFSLGYSRNELIKNTSTSLEIDTDTGNRELITPKDNQKATSKKKKHNNAELQLLTALSNLDRTIIEKNIKTINQLKEIGCPDILLDQKDIYIKAINTNAEKVRELIDSLNTLKNFGDIFKLAQALYSKTASDAATPKVLLDQMFSKVKVTDHTIICDPCMGSGAILAYAYQYLHCPKDNLYGFDIVPENVSVMKSLGFNHVYLLKNGAQFEDDWNDILKLIEKEVNIKDMKFDYIIMNPPYNGKTNIELKILDKVRSHANKIVSLQPAVWMKKNMINKQKSSWKKVFQGSIESIDIIDHRKSNDLFGLGNKIEELGIFYLTEDGHLDLEHFDFDSETEYNLYKKVNVTKKALTFGSCAGNKYGQCGYKLKDMSNYRHPHDLGVWGWHGGKTCQEAVVDTTSEVPSQVLYFNSDEERDNFIKSLDTTFIEWYYHTFIIPGDYKIFAYMWRVRPDSEIYTHPGKKGYEEAWTNEDYYHLFNLNEDEIKLLEDTVKEYK